MKLTKKIRRYIAEIAEKSAVIFEQMGFEYGLDGTPMQDKIDKAHIPNKIELMKAITQLVEGYVPMDVASSGRFYIMPEEESSCRFVILLDISGEEKSDPLFIL